MHRELCGQILAQLEGKPSQSLIEGLLDRLFDLPVRGETLKRIVVVVESQISRSDLDLSRVRFLRDLFAHLRDCDELCERDLEWCYGLMKAYFFNPFRGSITSVSEE